MDTRQVLKETYLLHKMKDEKTWGLEEKKKKSPSVKLVSLSRSLQRLCFLQKSKSPLMWSRLSGFSGGGGAAGASGAPFGTPQLGGWETI